MQGKQIAKRMKKLLAASALRSAGKGANTACNLYFYQPKESDAVKRMRKF